MKKLTPKAWARLVLMAIAGTAVALRVYGPLAALFLLLCCTAGYAVFCRLVIVSWRTWAPIRVAFVLVAIAILFSIFSVLFWHHRPTYVELALIGALAVLLVVASRRWRTGAPTEFETDRAPLERAGSL